MNEDVVAFFLALELIIFILCLIGNLLVCYVMVFKENLKSSSSKYIFSMSVADLLVGIIAIPTGGLQAMDFRPHNFEACATLMIMIVLSSGASLTSVLALSISRFWAICFPFSYRNQNTARLDSLIIVTFWILPVLTIFPLLFDSGMRSRFDNKCKMTTILSFNTMRLQSVFTLMYIALMIVLHYFMYKRLSVQASISAQR